MSTMQGTCLKCKLQDLPVILARKEHYCHSCFLHFCRAKYRRSQDAFRLALTDAERRAPMSMLLAVSGSVASCALVEMVHGVIERTQGAYPMPGILHIDMTGFRPISKARTARLAWLKATFQDMAWTETPLEKLDSLTGDRQIRFTPDALDGTPHRTQTETATPASLHHALSQLGSQTAQEDLLGLYRDALLLSESRSIGARCVQFADSATTTAAKVLAQTALGRGYALPGQVADSCEREGVWIVRPLKQLLAEELATYATLVGIPPASSDAIVNTTGKAASIGLLTKRYFATLEKDFPSLVATVVRTTGKLVAPKGTDASSRRCPVCAMEVGIGARDWLRNMTSHRRAADDEASAATQECEEEDEEEEDLCYGCLVALRSSRGPIQLAEMPLSRRSRKDGVLADFTIEED